MSVGRQTQNTLSQIKRERCTTKSRVQRITLYMKLICDTNEYRKHQKNNFTVKIRITDSFIYACHECGANKLNVYCETAVSFLHVYNRNLGYFFLRFVSCFQPPLHLNERASNKTNNKNHCSIDFCVYSTCCC